MKKHLLVFLCLLLVRATSWSQTATVRGRLMRGVFPAVYVQVTVYNQFTARSVPAVTGQDGMYYLTGIPFGDYYLEVWTNPQQPLVYPIRVAYLVTDIPQIYLP
jgi:hypothetical protein